MSTFRVGVIDQLVNSLYSPSVLTRANYLTAVAAGLDSFWVADHLNSALPRSIATPQYLGGAKLALGSSPRTDPLSGEPDIPLDPSPSPGQ
jgi:phthiodiolone/phenolphthiodiolone dimycocerosates ketoreductase